MAKSKTDSLIINLSNKVDSQHIEVNTRLNSIEKVMTIQEVNLASHMKRSDHLEAIIDNLKEKDIGPLNVHKNRVEGALKLLGVISLLVGIIVGIVSLFRAI